jgi:hypothetical protein
VKDEMCKSFVPLIVVAVLATQAEAAPTCFDEHTQQVLRAALDRALQDHITSLFAVMMRDSRDQPQRAIIGARKAITVYRSAVRSLECAPR